MPCSKSILWLTAPRNAFRRNVFFDRGITKIWIKEVHGRYSKNYIYVKIKFLRALGTSSHKIMPYTISNARKVIRLLIKY